MIRLARKSTYESDEVARPTGNLNRTDFARSSISEKILVGKYRSDLERLPFIGTGRPDNLVRIYYAIIRQNWLARLINSEIVSTIE